MSNGRRTLGDGYWPRFSDDGRILVCGNLDLSIIDTITMERVVVGRWDPEERFGPKGLHRCLRLIQNRRATWVEHFAGTPPSPDDAGRCWRWEADIETDPLRVTNVRKTSDDPWLVAPSWFEATNGHWASSLVHPQGRKGLTYDNKIVPNILPHFMSMARDGGILTVADTPVYSTMVIVKPDRTEAARFPMPPNCNVFRLHQSGWFGYGYWGPATVMHPWPKRNIDISVTSWLKESPPVLVDGPNGSIWAWTVVMDEKEQQWIAGRPFNPDGPVERECILEPCIEGATENMDVVLTGTEWTIATSSDIGRGAIYNIPVNAPRRAFTKPTTPPEPEKPEEHAPEGTHIPNIRDYVIGTVADAWPRADKNGSPMNCVLKDRSAYFVKGAVAGHPQFGAWPIWERWGWDEHWMYHLEDHSMGLPAPGPSEKPGPMPTHPDDIAAQTDSYAWFPDRRWIPRAARVGEEWMISTTQRTYDRFGRVIFERPYKYKTKIVALIRNMKWGGKVGTRDTLVVLYDPRFGEKPRPDGTLAGDYEINYFALGYGWVKWTSWKSKSIADGGGDFQTYGTSFELPSTVAATPSVGHIPAEWWTQVEPVEPEKPVEPQKPVVGYSAFLQEMNAIAAAYKDATGHEPAPTDLAHNAYRRLVERRSLETVIRLIYTERGKTPPQ